MLASFRHFLRFIDLDEEFDKHGFQKKCGAAFKINAKREGFTDFIASGGPNGYAWNVVRSEADEMMFRHAEKQGAKVFDGVKVLNVEFDDSYVATDKDTLVGELGKPVAVTWSNKEGATGTLKFDYLVDASGRAGIISTKHLKNRKFNQALKNVATWAYWKGVKPYAPGTNREGQPFFEVLDDASGWVWTIPLHDGTTSVGIVRRQDLNLAHRRSLDSPSDQEFYREVLKRSSIINETMMQDAEVVTEIKTASDYSYSASAYSSPYVRIVGDAGCFIDPYFSSGVHLALASGLSAAMTIQASRNGELSEFTAAKWHSTKVRDGYTRFLMVVLSVLKQIRLQDELLISDVDEDGFDNAFRFFRPIIQGQADADVGGRLTQNEVAESIDFCTHAFDQYDAKDKTKVIEKLDRIKIESHGTKDIETKEDLEKLSEEELKILKGIRVKDMARIYADVPTIMSLDDNSMEGYVPRLVTGSLGLSKASTSDVVNASLI